MSFSNDIGISKLEYLCELIHQKSVSKAAKKCYITQSAMSHVLKEFRTLFNDPLLIKIGNKMEATAYAKQLYITMYPKLCELKETLTQNVSFDPKKYKRTFNLIGLDYIELISAPIILKSIAPWEETLSVNFLFKPYETIAHELAHEVDFLITYSPNPSKDLEYVELFEEKFICLSRKNHPHIQHPLTLDAFLQLKHIQILHNAGSYYFVKNKLKELGHDRHIHYTTPSFLASPQIVSETDMVITISQSLITLYFNHLELDQHELPFEMPNITLKLCWHPLKNSDPAHQWFKNHLIEVFKRRYSR